MSNQQHNNLSADCENCFGLCCVALPYAKSADFPFNKDSGVPCKNLQLDYRCSIHNDLRKKGFKGCTVYECFGAGQKVSKITFNGRDWRESTDIANDMFAVFPIMQQLHEMLCYINEALLMDETKSIHNELQDVYREIENLTFLKPESIINLDVPIHRTKVNQLLLRSSELVRAKVMRKNSKIGRGSDLIGAKLKGADLSGANLRGALLIAADLSEADMRVTDLIGADLRDANLSGANLLGSIFLTQAQINSAKGDRKTKLPPTLKVPKHWLD